ncbi:MAG: glycosyltransferase family 4 protein, partial [Candidatus Eremiobacterota bacterium]
ASELSKKYKVILRCYAYELFCPLVFWFDRKKVINCDNTILKDHFTCVKCFHKHYPFLTGILKIPVYALKKFIPSDLYVKIDSMIGYNKIYHEFYGSLGFLPFFRERTLEAIKKSHIIASNNLVGEILEQYNKNIYIIPGGVDIDRFIPVQKNNNMIKRILLSGNVDIIKGHQIMKEACRILQKKRHDFKMCITLNRKDYIHKEEFIYNLGWADYREIHKLYQGSDICVVPSICREGFGLVAIEAMACGIPVVASEIGGLKSSIVDGVTGYLVPPGNPEKLAEKLEYLLDNPALREEMGKAGRKRAKENYSWEKIIEKYYIPLFENL